MLTKLQIGLTYRVTDRVSELNEQMILQRK